MILKNGLKKVVKATTDNSKTIIQAIYSILLGALAILTYNLTSTVKDATVSQAKSAHATARAYIAPGNFTVNNLVTPSMQTDYSLRNVGQTLAFHIVLEKIESIMWRSESIEQKFSLEPDFETGVLVQDIIAPGDSFTFEGLANNKEFSKEELKALADGKALYVVRIKVSYRDVFNDMHVSIFCRQMAPTEKNKEHIPKSVCPRATFFN